jgi:hypothetical protein
MMGMGIGRPRWGSPKGTWHSTFAEMFIKCYSVLAKAIRCFAAAPPRQALGIPGGASTCLMEAGTEMGSDVEARVGSLRGVGIGSVNGAGAPKRGISPRQCCRAGYRPLKARVAGLRRFL